MTSLEFRLLAYGLLLLAIMLGSGWAGHKLTVAHYERVIQADKTAQDLALQVAQQRVIDAQKAQESAVQTAEKQYADLKANYDGLSARLADSVRQYAEVSRGLVSASSTATALANAASEGAKRNSELTELVRQATQSCLDDAAELSALQVWAAGIGRP